MATELQDIACDFADGLKSADARAPQALNSKSKVAFLPGIGPHTEAQTVSLVMKELAVSYPQRYQSYALGERYPRTPRQKCDLCIGIDGKWEWAIEVKMIRFLGDNGKVNDNILMHVLSPYPAHRSAVTDCEKLIQSGLWGRKAILIYGFDHDEWPLDPAIEAFEVLARARVPLGARCVSSFGGLIHPVHSKGRVFCWELLSHERGATTPGASNA